MKISAFTITTNCLKNQYPVIESIRSVLPEVDELIVVDGHSTDGTVEVIRALQDDKIKIVQDKETKWEDDWTYWRMGKNWARGFDESTGDWVIKFDTDYIFKEGLNLRKDMEEINNNSYILYLNRKNFQLTDRYFHKVKKTLAVNVGLCKKNKIDVRWGYDLKNWGMCDEAIIYEQVKDKLLQGKLLRKVNTTIKVVEDVFNYGYSFRDEKIGRELMFRNMRAFYRQSNHRFKDKDGAWGDYKRTCEKYFKISPATHIKIEEHPVYIQERIKNLEPDKQGYNFWGKFKNDYYK